MKCAIRLSVSVPYFRRSLEITYLRGPIMTPSDQPSPSASDADIPFMQRLLDNPFLLLFLGVAIPTVIYIIWGIIEITAVPLAK